MKNNCQSRENSMPFITFDKSFEFLNGGNINVKD